MRKQNTTHSLFFAAVLAVSVFLSGGSAFGQFVVQPMRMDLTALPRKVIETGIDLHSTDPNEEHEIDLSIAELSQWQDGEWRIIEPNSGVDLSKLSSCSKWISLGSKSVKIPLLGTIRVPVTIRVPPRTRGFYVAGIIASVKPRPVLAAGIQADVKVRFLIAVLITVQGRPLPHKIELGEMGLEFIEPYRDNPATTNVLMNIDNNGGTRSHIKGFAQVKGFLDGHWRTITTAEFDSTRIIPGAKLQLRSNLGRSLPTAKYRVSGWLYVDGRRASRTMNELDFVGDTSVTKVVTDAPLDLDPSVVSISCQPGATRPAVIKVYNASDETVNVQADVRLPHFLQGVAFGDLKGVDLDCSGWLKIEPEKFTLRSHAQQSIRIIAEMPETASIHPCYYSLLGLSSTYADGQRAGVKTANICFANENISTAPFVYGKQLNQAFKEGSEYYIVARYGNFGRIHITPIRCRAAVVDITTSMPVVRTALSSMRTGLMLPLEARDFSGVIDLSQVPVGLYRLAAVLEYDSGEKVTQQKAIRVMAQGGRKVMEVVQLQEDLGEKIEVKW